MRKCFSNWWTHESM